MSAEVDRFRELLARHLGWMFNDNDAGQLGQVLKERARLQNLSPAAYLTRLSTGWMAEVTGLAENLSITETYFFRHGEQFRALQDDALPDRVKARSAQRVLRMMSVACSSGEEAYSLAISARQIMPDPDWIIRVLGVDANPAVLRKAEAAVYSAWSLRETPDTVRARWFRPSGGGYRVADEARQLVQFQRQNLAEDNRELWQPGQYDVIFCRNVLMYLTEGTAAQLIRWMTGALAPGGYLFLGHTDSLGSRPADLEPCHTRQAFYYQRPAVRTARIEVPAPAPVRVPDIPRPQAPLAEDLHEKSLVLLRDERFVEALALLGPPSPTATARDRLLRGVLLAQTGRLGEASAVAQEMIDRDGINPDAHQLLGLCHDGTGATDLAVVQYRLAAYMDPGFALPRLRMGQIARRRRDDRAASADLRLALDLLAREDDERITLFGGGFGRIALTVLCRSELDACEARL